MSRLLPAAFGVSVFLHAGMVFFMRLDAAMYRRPDGPLPQAAEPDIFSLISIQFPSAEPVPAPAVAPAVVPQVAPPVPNAAEPEQQAEDLQAETYILLEEIPPDAVEPPPSAGPPAPPSGPVETAGITARPPGSAGNPESAALTGAYVSRNVTYIQRRIRDRLKYPPPARRAGIQGAAEVGFTINRDGTVSGVSILTTSGHEILDLAALAAVHDAAPFPPPQAAARLAIPVVFKLR